jgi:outer membrane protein assembly factor BamB
MSAEYHMNGGRVKRILTVASAFALVIVSMVCKKTPVGHPPATPSAPSGITNGCISTSYDFTATTTDPDSDSVCYRFQWGDGATSEWCNWVASGETASMSHTWTSANTYQVKVQAKDRPDNTTDWSAALAVTITNNRPPGTPAVPSGPSTAPKDSVCIFTSIATDPDGDGVSYRFDWGNGDTSEWGNWAQSGSPGAAGYAYPRSGAFQVRAQARDINEARSAWSSPLSIIIRNPYPPTTPSAPTGPSSGNRGETLTFASTASDSGGDSISIRFSWGDGDTSAWSTLVRSDDTVRMTHAWQGTGSYQMMAQARDEDGLTSGWSSPSEVIVTWLKWRYQSGGSVWSSPAIGSDGTIYFGSYDSCLYAVSPDGTLKWRYGTGGSIGSSPAVGLDGTVHVGSRDGYAYAVNPDGTLEWKYSIGSPVVFSPAIGSDGTVYYGAEDDSLYAFDPDGSLKWGFKAGNAMSCSPVVGNDGTVYFEASNHLLYAVTSGGALKWTYSIGAYASSLSPSIGGDGTIYVGSHGAHHCLSALSSSGSLKWSYDLYVNQSTSSPVVGTDGTIYVFTLSVEPVSGPLHALNPDGTLKWKHYYSSNSTPAISTDGTIYYGYYDLGALNPDGTLRWTCPTGGVGVLMHSSPAIGPDGTIYVGSDDGCLYAVQGSGPLANSPWPKFRHDNKNTGCVGGGK